MTLFVLPKRNHPRAPWVPAGRTLHLVDIENLMGGPLAGRACALNASVTYRDVAGVAISDHVIIGTNPGLALVVNEVWPDARMVVRAGHDGADLALIECADHPAWTAARYDRVVIGSGDGAFATLAADIRGLGVTVGVVARAGRLSRNLATAASFVRLLPEDVEPAVAA